ncbi:hypothetical protein HanXRQr2_Chr15g0720661 [Helianthus annuus]|uniref:Uncharacterized protein n=1 Tax=Helianthus annuus TaxID=4232 RepID=A0A9K3E4K9_HELAN|nr:hypothetical protein HanXRQr2_Chr15g0720661 [Helianthus annuus]KAJ0453215.1 hypothetical protein HanHA300_Chr15g0587871 [Helianthus annuus]KAJ0475133.1 hypothetical protein HanHA89_Chr15g0637691 [Helianthus annuus]KAJ0650688.1 hypothetical protein HanLR1_Chr15g0598601 [Helianthus annuus]KAJ0654440.1 hypothetical protein HanOQP8_Chr15g0595011 [Helianthus annuus]
MKIALSPSPSMMESDEVLTNHRKFAAPNCCCNLPPLLRDRPEFVTTEGHVPCALSSSKSPKLKL